MAHRLKQSKNVYQILKFNTKNFNFCLHIKCFNLCSLSKCKLKLDNKTLMFYRIVKLIKNVVKKTS